MGENSAGRFYIDVILKSKGMEALNRLHSHSFTLNILQMNSRELAQVIEYTEHGKFMLHVFSEESKGASQQMHREANRLVHNYLCAVSTFADHVRHFMEEYYAGTRFHSNYQAEVQRVFNADGYCRFVRDLRNYLTHRGLPDSSMKLNITRADDASSNLGTEASMTTGVYYGVAEFLEWGKWSPPARRFLESAGDDLSLRTIFDEHFKIMNRFGEWFEVEFRKHHASDIDQLVALQAEYERLQREEARSP